MSCAELECFVAKDAVPLSHGERKDLEEEDQPSGITVFADGNSEEKIEEVFNVDVSEPKKKMSMAFPGINAPIPENVDQSCWGAPQMPINARMPESVDQTCFAAAQKPTSFNSYSTPLNYRLNNSPLFNFSAHSYNTRWLRGYTIEPHLVMSNHAHNYHGLNQHYMPYKSSPHSFPN